MGFRTDSYERTSRVVSDKIDEVRPTVDAKTDELRAKVDLARERMDQLRESLSDAVASASEQVQNGAEAVADSVSAQVAPSPSEAEGVTIENVAGEEHEPSILSFRFNRLKKHVLERDVHGRPFFVERVCVKTNELIGIKVYLPKSRIKRIRKPTAALVKTGRIHVIVFDSDLPQVVGVMVKRPDIAGMVKRNDVFVAFDALATFDKGFLVTQPEGSLDKGDSASWA